MTNERWNIYICFVLFRLAIIAQWLQACPLSLWLCCVGGVGGHFCTCPISYAFLGNKEWPKPKPVQHCWVSQINLSISPFNVSTQLLLNQDADVVVWQQNKSSCFVAIWAEPSSARQESSAWVSGWFWCSPGVTPLLSELPTSENHHCFPSFLLCFPF